MNPSALCNVEEPAFPRIDVQDLGTDFVVHPQTKDLYLDPKTGDLATVSGLKYFPQMLRSTLSVEQRENVFHPDFGMYFYEYFQEFHGSAWLNWLLKLDVIRQASIRFTDSVLNQTCTPLQYVSRVRAFELRADEPENNRIPIHLEFDVQGYGTWQSDISVYLPTRQQMVERAKLIAQRSLLSKNFPSIS